MRPHCAAFVAVSLDGFIARPDGSIDWLERANAAMPPGEDCGYAEFMAGIDAIVMGRRTFGRAIGFDAWPYGGTPVYVLSGSLRQLPQSAPAQEGRIVVDFNRAFNRPCAFTPYAACPLPPPESRLGIAVTAGERRYRDKG